MNPLALILVLVVLFLVFGGWHGHSTGLFVQGGPVVYGGGLLGTIIVVLLLVWLLRGGL